MYRCTLNFDTNVYYENAHIVGALAMHNPCCSNRPVVVVGMNDADPEGKEVKAYIAQCACGLTHTEAYNTPANAMKAWEDISRTMVNPCGEVFDDYKFQEIEEDLPF